MRLHELFESAHQQEDLVNVARWYDTTPDNIQTRVASEPISKFLDQIDGMEATYEEFPHNELRTDKIVKLIQSGATVYPIYVEDGDSTLFVMEGRHRMVAFKRLGMTTIPVAYVSCIDPTNCHSLLPYARRALGK